MKLPHLLNSTCYTAQLSTTSYWPSCTQQPKTLSFRSILRDEAALFSTSSEPPKSSSALIEDLLKEDGGVTIERVIQNLKSDHRLLFELDKTNGCLDNSHVENDQCVTTTLVSMESRNPYLDFKKSMEEMVEAHHGVMDWDWLHELLGCYLNVNGKCHHEFIIGAFLDLLMSLDLDALGLMSFSSLVASPSTFSSSNITTSCCSSSNSPTDETATGT